MFEFVIFDNHFFRVNLETGDAWEYQRGMWVAVEEEDDYSANGIN